MNTHRQTHIFVFHPFSYSHLYSISLFNFLFSNISPQKSTPLQVIKHSSIKFVGKTVVTSKCTSCKRLTMCSKRKLQCRSPRLMFSLRSIPVNGSLTPLDLFPAQRRNRNPRRETISIMSYVIPSSFSSTCFEILWLT